MKNATQLKAYVRNLSQEKGVNAQILLRTYMMERLLERISISRYKNSLILKGGMLIAAWIGLEQRSTLDMDATIQSVSVTPDTVRSVFSEILAFDINDGVAMEINSIDEIRDEADYPGFRLALDVSFNEIRMRVKVDLTTGDVITPQATAFRYNLMFEQRSIDIMAYNLETVLAEKLETLLYRSTANSRMRDFYDLYVLSKTNPEQIDYQLLAAALSATCEARGTSALLPEAEKIALMVSKNDSMRDYWMRYQKQYDYAADISWEDVSAEITALMKRLNL